MAYPTRARLKEELLVFMNEYCRKESSALIHKLERDRIVFQVSLTEGGAECVNISLELHPENERGDDPASIWISARYGDIAEYGVLLAHSDGRITLGDEFRSL